MESQNIIFVDEEGNYLFEGVQNNVNVENEGMLLYCIYNAISSMFVDYFFTLLRSNKLRYSEY